MSKYFSRAAKAARRAERHQALSSVGEALNKREAKMKLTSQNVGQAAIGLVREIFDSYQLPSKPSLGYSGVRSARLASNRIDRGVITVHAEFRTRTGVNVGLDIPIEVRDGLMIEPSVIVYNGSPRIIAQSTFDNIVENNTFTEKMRIRPMYAAPLTPEQNAFEVKNRASKTRVNKGMFATASARNLLRQVMSGRAITADVAVDLKIVNEIGRKVQSALDGMNAGMLGSFDDMSGMAPALLASGEKLVVALSGIGADVAPLNEAMHKAEAASDVRGYASAYRSLLGLVLDYKSEIFDYNQLPGSGERIKNPQFAHDVMAAMFPMAHALGISTAALAAASTQTPAQTESKQVSAQYIEEFDYDDVDTSRNVDPDDFSNPAEREPSLSTGDTTSLSEEVEIRNRGGGVDTYSSGTSVMIVRDLAGDGTAYVVEFEDGLQAIVESSLLKGASLHTAEDPQDSAQPATRECLNCKKMIFTPFDAVPKGNNWQGHFCSEACRNRYIYR